MSDNKPQGSISRIMEWASHPFSSDMSALDWLLFLGLVIVGIVLWLNVMHHLTGAE